MKNARHKARELALQGLYQWLLAQEQAQEIRAQLAEFKGYDKADAKYLRLLLDGTIADAAELEAAFGPLLDRPVDELSPVERGVLLLGAYELAHVPEVPYRVVINEAVELAKSYRRHRRPQVRQRRAGQAGREMARGRGQGSQVGREQGRVSLGFRIRHHPPLFHPTGEACAAGRRRRLRPDCARSRARRSQCRRTCWSKGGIFSPAPMRRSSATRPWR